MSATVNPHPAPVQTPTPVVTPAPPKRSKWRYFVILALVAGGCWTAYKYFLQPKADPASSAPSAGGSAQVRSAKVVSGPIDRTLRLNGVTAAKDFAAMLAPMMRGPDAGRALVLIDLAKSGTLIKKGQLVAQIDAQSIQDHLDDVKAQVIQADADIRKRKAEQATATEDMRQNIRNAKADWDKAKLDAGASEIRTPVDAEILKLASEEAEATYNQLASDMKNREIADRAEIRILEITKERQVRHQARHDADVVKFTMRAPIDGLVVMESIFRGGEMAQIQLGDQVSPGQPFMKIVNPARMQMEATANQVDSEEMRIGQAVSLQFDAFPGLSLPGKVQSLGALGVGGWRQNYYIRNVAVRVAILGSDPRLIPDLSTSGDIVVEHKDNAVLLPLGSIFSKDGREQVFVKRGEKWEPREVKLGLRNGTHGAVLSGVDAGDEVALDNPTPKPEVIASN